MVSSAPHIAGRTRRNPFSLPLGLSKQTVGENACSTAFVANNAGITATILSTKTDYNVQVVSMVGRPKPRYRVFYVYFYFYLFIFVASVGFARIEQEGNSNDGYIELLQNNYFFCYRLHVDLLGTIRRRYLDLIKCSSEPF